MKYQKKALAFILFFSVLFFTWTVLRFVNHMRQRKPLVIEDESSALQLKNQLNRCESKLIEANHWLRYCAQQVEGCVAK